MEKLVRDKIPDIIKADGREASIRKVEGQEYVDMLCAKLDEEGIELKEALQGFMDDPDRLKDLQGEISDVLEVVAAIVEVAGINTDELFELADAKREDRGAFKEGFVLKMDD